MKLFYNIIHNYNKHSNSSCDFLEHLRRKKLESLSRRHNVPWVLKDNFIKTLHLWDKGNFYSSTFDAAKLVDSLHIGCVIVYSLLQYVLFASIPWSFHTIRIFPLYFFGKKNPQPQCEHAIHFSPQIGNIFKKPKIFAMPSNHMIIYISCCNQPNTHQIHFTIHLYNQAHSIS